MNTNFRSPILIVVLLGGGVPVLGSLLLLEFMPGWTWAHYPTHAAVESLGAFASITIAALVLMMVSRGQLERAYFWVAAGLIGMGLLDGLHSMLEAGQSFVWTHSLATFVGGACFACVWLPVRRGGEKHTAAMLTAVVTGCAALGILPFAAPGQTPQMVADAQFTFAAAALNIVGGVGFLAAAVYFLRKKNADENQERMVFSTHAFLFGVAGILFELSALWDPAWWFWHGLRLVAYLVAFHYFLTVFQASLRSLLTNQEQLEAKVAERTQELQASQEHLRQLSQAVEQNPNLIFITNLNGIIQFANKKFYEATGYTPSEVIGDTPRILKSGKTPDEVYKSLWTTISSGNIWRGEMLDRRKDGTHFWAAVSIAPIRDSSSQVTHFCCTHLDIDLIKQAERMAMMARAEAESANQLKSEFLANMSHEIRTPLNGVIGMAQLLRHTELDEEQSLSVETILASGRVLLALINDVLDLSKIEVGMLTLEHHPFDLEQLVKTTVNTVAGTAQSKPVTLTYEIEQSLSGTYSGDEKRLGQVLINLVGNALKFTDQGRVTVKVAPHGDGQIYFGICDTGPGIDAQNQQKIFKRFVQADGSVTRKHGGTGLGLAICQDIVSLMGGKIGVKSTLGEGSEFWFTVPMQHAVTLGQSPSAAPSAESTYAPAHEQDTSAQSGENGTFSVLLAEDNHVNRDVVLFCLRRLEFVEVVCVENGADAISALDERPFDLVLMDINMPIMSGDEAIRRIRKSQAPYRDIPILVMTANAFSRQREQYLSDGATQYFAKPIDTDRLADTICRLHSGKQTASAQSA